MPGTHFTSPRSTHVPRTGKDGSNAERDSTQRTCVGTGSSAPNRSRPSASARVTPCRTIPGRAPSRSVLRGSATLLALGLAGSCAGLPGGGASVTPQRPTFSSDTNTTAEGTLELESGLFLDPGDAAALPTVLKYGAGPRTELFVGLSPFNFVELPGEDARGVGDTIVGTRHRFWENDTGTSSALQLATKLPTGDESEGLSTGEIDFFAAGILTHVFSERTAGTAYYELGVLGDPADTDTDTRHTVAIAASHSLDDHLGLYAELAQILDIRGFDPLITTLGVTRSVNPSLVLDFGLALGLNGDAPDAALVAGLTMNFGRVRGTGATSP